ncbi:MULTISPECIES: RagB/SusD family nutrient uptake outer membrane protein [Niastella]|uniref:RagB/SusD family nutrient uptake outer membrane protein n=1 Tax=Niastella soli TaxID=2821487 RepID=A0ABS3YNI8_9BACT|nr:RagB/SusD family nutrient uptake outer membrane protein [Niastella soli]MBO9199455.1 RagB/SusD family nutrient uptake outer membrane protein [Niastella soli]
MKLTYISAIGLVLSMGCTKLDQSLQDSFSNPAANTSTASALLTGAYNSMAGLMHAQDQMFSLQETTTDEALIPVRGGDWDDNGVWRVLHAHTWTPIHSQFKAVYNGLGNLESSAITVLAFNPNATQRAEALFLRSLAQFYFLDLYGQVPYRPVSEYNSIGPAPVLQPKEAIDTLVATLTAIIPQLPATNKPYKASPDAARFLLMKVLLNKGAFLNRQTPTFDNADMQQVIALGNTIITTGGYSLTPNYFDNFGPQNATTSNEMILAWPNTGASSNPDGITSGGINARWMMTLHYNSWEKKKGEAGWNGFSTVADFYNTFGATDKRVGGNAYPGVTDVSGLRPGLLVGQQFNEKGDSIKDRQGNPLKFTPEVKLIETDKNRLEVAGIRVIKYPPDYAAYSDGNQKNQLQIFRYADVVLMVAEAMLRQSSPNTAGALGLINPLRATRGATALATITLVNPGNVYDPTTLLAERGREMYWESWRRQDLIRFGVYLKQWALKDADADPLRNLLFPIAPDELLANPNLKQNPGYSE